MIISTSLLIYLTIGAGLATITCRGVDDTFPPNITGFIMVTLMWLGVVAVAVYLSLRGDNV